MTKIIVADNSAYVTGAIKSIVALAKALAGQYQFEFAMDTRGEAARYVREAGYEVNDIRYQEISKSWRVALYPFALLANAHRLARLARRRDVRILHINDLYNQAGILAKLFYPKLKVVYHVRLTPDSYLKPIYPIFAWLISRWADAIVYVSRAAGDKFLDAPQASLIHDALGRPPALPPKQSSSELANCRYLYVGNYVRGKGQNFALEAFSRIASRLPNASLRFVGSGAAGELDRQYVAELQARATDEGLHERVHFDGPANDIERVMKEANVVVNLSESESFSMVCLEALTYGLPLVVSDCGGPRELVQNGGNGMLIENRNIDQATDAMYRLATEPGLASRLGAAGPSSVTVKFSTEKSAKKLVAVYEALLSQ